MKKIEKKTKMLIVKIVCTVLVVAIVATSTGFGVKYHLDGIVPEEVHNAVISQKVDKATDEVRIMSSNILASYPSWHSEYSRSIRKVGARPRSKIYFEIMDTYKPDVIGMQEVNYDWYKELLTNEQGYEFIYPQEKEHEHLTCIMYNTNTTKLLEKDFFDFKSLPNNDGKLRRVEWGLFENIASGKKFIVATTHFDLIRGKEEEHQKYFEIMQNEVIEFTEFAKNIKEKYNVPVYMTGDYNTVNNIENWKELFPEKTEEQMNNELIPNQEKIKFNQAPTIYESLVQSLVDTKLVAKEFNAVGTTTITTPTYDHIFTNASNEISRFVIISDPVMLQLSDHYTIFADVKL